MVFEVALFAFFFTLRPAAIIEDVGDGVDQEGHSEKSVDGQESDTEDGGSSKKISRLVSQDDPVPDGLRQASMEQTVIDATVAYFKKEVMPDLNPHLKDDTIDKMVKLISIDMTIHLRKSRTTLRWIKPFNYSMKN